MHLSAAEWCRSDIVINFSNDWVSQKEGVNTYVIGTNGKNVP